MPYIRRDVWKLPSDDKTLDWYQKAIEELKRRPFEDNTSWLSFAAIHGFNPVLWQDFGYIDPKTDPPSMEVQKTLWNQCQHMTWYFLSWHRGYLAAFEAIVRDAVKQLGGPNDWALPYWNYSDDVNARKLPPAFASPTLASGSTNHLYVKQRYGKSPSSGIPQSPIVLDERVVGVQKALQQRFFTGSSGGSPGFGGLKTPFSHGDGPGTFGALENQPHGAVHVAVGGRLGSTPDLWGLMTNPDTAALDPIFWLHHANIDRLWNLWLRQHRPSDKNGEFQNPQDSDWLNGPLDRKFAMPVIGGKIEYFTSKDVLDTKAFDYVYDDEGKTEVLSNRIAGRLENLGVAPARADELAGALAMAPQKDAELLGANDRVVRLDTDIVETHVLLDAEQHRKLSMNLDISRLGTTTIREPDHVYLNLENIKSPSDAGLFYVYVNLPKDADPEQHPDHFAGTVSTFGVSKASDAQGAAGGNGVNASFDITAIIDKIHLGGGLGGELSVKLVAAIPGITGDDISIGRISVYRQEQ